MAKLPVIQQNTQLVNSNGQPTFQFTNFLNQLTAGIGGNTSDLASHLTEIETLYSELKVIASTLPTDVESQLSSLTITTRDHEGRISYIEKELASVVNQSFRGEFDALAEPAYGYGDTVTFNGQTYLGIMDTPVLVDVPEEDPGTGTRWLLIVQHLDDLLDVTLTSPVNHQLLSFDGTNWVNITLHLDDVFDVDTTGVSNGQALVYDSGSSTWKAGTVAANLAGLTDVTLTSPTDGQVLTFDNATGKWKNANPTGGSGGGSGGSGTNEFAYASFNVDMGTGAITINHSKNIASITRISTGRYLVTWTTPPADHTNLQPILHAWYDGYSNFAPLDITIDRNSDQLSGDGLNATGVVLAANPTGYEAAKVRVSFVEMGVSSGGSNILAKVFSETATAGLNIFSPLLVPDMTTTFTLASATDVRIEFDALLSRAGGRCRIHLYIDGSEYFPIDSHQHWYSNDQGEYNVQNVSKSTVVSLASGSHTIEIWANDALSVQTTTFWERSLIVTDLNASSGGGGSSPSIQVSESLTDVGTPNSNLNFTGSGVTVTSTVTGRVDIDIPGGSGGGSGDLHVVPTMIVPTSSDFTITKPSGATATLSDLSGSRGVNCISYPASNGWQGTLLTYTGWSPPSSGSWSFAVLMSGRAVNNGMGWGPAVYDSSNRVLIEGCNSGTNTRWIFDSLALDNNTNRDATNSEGVGDKLIEWWRLRSDGTNIYGERSIDGDNWWVTDTVGISWFTSGTLVHVGIAAMEYYSTFPQHISIYGIQHS